MIDMTERKMILAFGEASVEHAKDGIMMGLDPVYVSEVLILCAYRLLQDHKGSAFAVAIIERALGRFRLDAADG